MLAGELQLVSSRRMRFFPVVWALVWPLRQYLMHSPWPRGKGFLTRRLLVPCLPAPPAMFHAPIGPKDTVLLQHRESVGLSYLMRGAFERAEIECACEHAVAGTAALDVGAHVGLFSIPLARAVGITGMVVAFEPLSDNAERLRRNLERNGVGNVHLLRAAASREGGEIELRLASDTAFASTAEVFLGRATGAVVRVPSVTVDKVWEELGRPRVSVVKVDVEGAEVEVLSGARSVIEACMPAILIEANTIEHLGRLTDWLGRYGYLLSQPPGFMPWNYLFLPGGEGA